MTRRMKLAWAAWTRKRLGRVSYRTCFRFDGGTWSPVETGNPYVADPFLFVFAGVTYLFYETLKEKKGVLGCFRREGGKWVDLGLVLEEPWHLSYPQVFEDGGRVYMIPESCDFRGQFKCGAVRLYEATDFPRGWRLASVLIGEPFSDSSLLRLGGHCYLSCGREFPSEAAELWHAPSLSGPWSRHPESANHNQSRRLRRNGGAFLCEGGALWRVAQDCNGAYGKRVFKVPILEISPTCYREGAAVLLTGGYRHTYNCAETPEGRMEVVDEMRYRYRLDMRAVLMALALPFQLAFRFSRRARGGRRGWLLQVLGIQFVHGWPVERPALVQLKI